MNNSVLVTRAASECSINLDILKNIYFFNKGDIERTFFKRKKWLTIPGCPSFMCFFFFFLNKGDIEGIISSKIYVCMFWIIFVGTEFAFLTGVVKN